MHSNEPNLSPKESPLTRKRRLKKRLDEISDRSEQELAALMRSVEKIKASFKNKQR